jgi:hypothetical protein
LTRKVPYSVHHAAGHVQGPRALPRARCRQADASTASERGKSAENNRGPGCHDAAADLGNLHTVCTGRNQRLKTMSQWVNLVGSTNGELLRSKPDANLGRWFRRDVP